MQENPNNSKQLHDAEQLLATLRVAAAAYGVMFNELLSAGLTRTEALMILTTQIQSNAYTYRNNPESEE